MDIFHSRRCDNPGFSLWFAVNVKNHVYFIYFCVDDTFYTICLLSILPANSDFPLSRTDMPLSLLLSTTNPISKTSLE